MKTPERTRRGPETEPTTREVAAAPGWPTIGPVPLATRHWSWGWRALWAFLCLGVVLEALHGFK
ncbi:MAG: hypothetical protein ACKPAH_15755, partial [Verrucomicrobiota bacterium]